MAQVLLFKGARPSRGAREARPPARPPQAPLSARPLSAPGPSQRQLSCAAHASGPRRPASADPSPGPRAGLYAQAERVDMYRARCACGRQGRQGAHAAAARAPARARQGRRAAPLHARVCDPRPGARRAHGPWGLGLTGERSLGGRGRNVGARCFRIRRLSRTRGLEFVGGPTYGFLSHNPKGMRGRVGSLN